MGPEGQSQARRQGTGAVTALCQALAWDLHALGEGGGDQWRTLVATLLARIHRFAGSGGDADC